LSRCPNSHSAGDVFCLRPDRQRGIAATPAPSRGQQPGEGEPPLAPSPRSLRGLDWFVFFFADVQTGFGPFVSVFLTTQKWTQVDIGLVLSAGGVVSLIGQMPGGVLVDAARSERLVGGIAIAAICISALAYAAMPVFPVVLSASILHAAASCVLGPAIAAISLGLVGHAAIGERWGATPASPRSATVWRRPRWGRAGICFPPAPSSS
jgi:predicted MFS family arabinose efflux permease